MEMIARPIRSFWRAAGSIFILYPKAAVLKRIDGFFHVSATSGYGHVHRASIIVSVIHVLAGGRHGFRDSKGSNIFRRI